MHRNSGIGAETRDQATKGLIGPSVSVPESASIVLTRAAEDCLLLIRTGEDDDLANPAGSTHRLLVATDRSLAGIGLRKPCARDRCQRLPGNAWLDVLSIR